MSATPHCAMDNVEEMKDNLSLKAKVYETNIHINTFTNFKNRGLVNIPQDWYSSFKKLKLDGEKVSFKLHYKCLIDGCGKVFNQARNIKSHFIIHTKEKAFFCSECKKGFTQRGNMVKHQQSIHNMVKQE